MRPAPATDLVARAERIDGSLDLLPFFVPDDGIFFEHPSRALVTKGAAVTITVPAGPNLVARAGEMAADALARVRYEEQPPIVVGALPFGENIPATLTIPQTTILRESDGSTKRLTVGDHIDPILAKRVPTLPRGTLKITPVPEPEAWMSAVAEARRRIRDDELRKVVLARMLIAQSDHVFDRRALLARLRDAEPNAYTFAAGGFIGASPELLVSRFDDVVRARPLAGTAARAAGSADEAAGLALLSSSKDLAEHALVVDAVREALTSVCDELEVGTPDLLQMSKVWHLATEFKGRLAEPLDALALASRLHPTPAVCGTPRGAAMEAIRELEQIDRTIYAGIVGWMDASGDGEWAVAIRCAEMQGRIALLFAGNGIVAESDPESELAETEAKFRSMLEALGYA
jgi:isochorismate synthase